MSDPRAILPLRDPLDKRWGPGLPAPRGRALVVASAPARRGPEPGHRRDLGSGGRVAEMSAGADDDVRTTESGIPVERVYDAADVAGLDLAGAARRARGRSPTPAASTPRCTASKPWTMRQYAGFATAEETNERFRYLLAAGAPGLSTAFDLPTQLGMDSDDPLAAGEVGRVGVAIDSVEDMARLFDGIPLDRGLDQHDHQRPRGRAAAALPAGGRGERAPTRAALRGTIQNDVLKEYVARGNYIYPPGAVDAADHRHVRLLRRRAAAAGTRSRSAATTSARRARRRCRRSRSRWPTASPTSRRRSPPGLDVDRFGPRLSFFFNAHNNLMEEVAKFRAARSLWAHIMRDRFGATEPRAMALRFHAQTGGSTLTAQQPAQQRRARGRAGALRGARRRPVDPLQRLRRGAGPAHRGVGQARPAHPAGDRRRVGHHATPSTRSAAATYVEALTAEIEERARDADRRDRRARRGGGVHRVHARGDRATPPSATTQEVDVRRAGGGRASTPTGRTTSSRCRSSASTRRSRSTRSRACAALRAGRDAGAGRGAGWPTCAPRPAAPPTCCPRCARRCGPGPPWARSAACCARSTASTTGCGRRSG